MKRILLTTLLAFVVTSLFAQDITMVIGTKKSMYTLHSGEVSVSERGKVVIIGREAAHKYQEFDVYGRLVKLGDLELTYYSDFNNYEAGKVKSIGNVKFSYYSNFNNYEAGKIRSIGAKNISYYSNFNNYEAGKIKAIGDVKFAYYSNFNNYEAGKIKSIGTEQYRYFTNFDDYPGELKSGKRKFTQSGVTFIVYRNFGRVE